jgi:hypothetical protein
MQVTIRHREEPGRSANKHRDYFVDCRIEFSEEEKAIIAARRLENQYHLTLPAALPYYAGMMEGGLPSGLVQTLTRLCVIATPILFVIAGTTGSNGLGALSLLLPFIAVGLFIYRKSMEKRSNTALDDQVISAGQLVNQPAFTVYAESPDDAKATDQMIRFRLTELKDAIMRNAEVRQMETFEL